MTTVSAYRLPTNVRPVRYAITLTPDLEGFTFTGEETIDLELSEAVSAVSLNAIELDVTWGELTPAGGGAISPSGITLDEEMETVTFAFDREIPAGAASLAIRFTGTLNDQLRGFYRSRYTTPEGEERYLATTQFEATDARRAFPCWDDPAAKAVFDVTLVIPANLVAISNTLPVSETPALGGAKSIRFAETPRMSTYLLAFLVGDFASVEERAPNGTLVRVWATRGKEEQGRFAVENAVRLLAYFNDYFGIPYPLEKLDHIAVPDFAAGAMENWGAITYRETVLLFDPENSSAATRQRIMEVVSHEMAHMWFGDLVTMEWWDDLWLNESFASWMGDKAVDHQYPEWNMWTQFVFQDTNSGLSLDGLRNSHPIEARVENPAQIRELFDAISYSKGGSVLRMLEDFLGAEVFRRGLHGYLSAHQYGNARTEDLWAALEEASGQPVTAIMNSWVKQMGYPVLSTRTHSHEGELRVALSQQRFLYDHLMDESEDDATLWQVPVGVARAGSDAKVLRSYGRAGGGGAAGPGRRSGRLGQGQRRPDRLLSRQLRRGRGGRAADGRRASRAARHRPPGHPERRLRPGPGRPHSRNALHVTRRVLPQRGRLLRVERPLHQPPRPGEPAPGPGLPAGIPLLRRFPLRAGGGPRGMGGQAQRRPPGLAAQGPPSWARPEPTATRQSSPKPEAASTAT